MKIRTDFISNSSSASFLLGIKGSNISNAVIKSFARHKEEYAPVLQDLNEDDYIGDPSAPLTLETIAKVMKDTSSPLILTDNEILRQLGKTSSIQKYLDFVKENARRQITKGLTLYWTTFMENEAPGRVIYYLFNHTDRKFHEDDEFCFLWMPAESLKKK